MTTLIKVIKVEFKRLMENYLDTHYVTQYKVIDIKPHKPGIK
jgi:hypothetical protein